MFRKAYFFFVSVASIAVASSAYACPPSGATVATNSMADLGISDTPHICDGSNRCTLRDALHTAQECSNGSLIKILLTRGALYNATWNAGVGLYTRFALTKPNTLVQIDGNAAILRGGDPSSAGSASSRYRIFHVGAGVQLWINDLTITNGKADRQSPNGAGIFNSGELTLRSVAFLENVNAWGRGGAIYNEGKLGVERSMFGQIDEDEEVTQGSSATGGGGAIANAQSGEVNISKTAFYNNSSIGNGGAIHNDGGNVTIDNSDMKGNIGQRGGAIYGRGGVLDVVRSTIRQNEATDGGGGLSMLVVSTSDRFSLTSSTIYENVANGSSNGGGLLITGAGSNPISTPIVRDVTIWKNRADNFGGGVALRDRAAVRIRNSIVAENPGGDCNMGAGSSVQAVDENLDFDSSCPGFTVHGAAQLRNIGDNGGPTWTLVPQSISPAFERGRNCLPQDQRGFGRPASIVTTRPPRCDIGAVEVQGLNDAYPGLNVGGQIGGSGIGGGGFRLGP